MRTYEVVPFTGGTNWQSRLNTREVICGSCGHVEDVHPKDWHLYCDRCHVGFCRNCVLQVHIFQQIFCTGCFWTD